MSLLENLSTIHSAPEHRLAVIIDKDPADPRVLIQIGNEQATLDPGAARILAEVLRQGAIRVDRRGERKAAP